MATLDTLEKECYDKFGDSTQQLFASLRSQSQVVLFFSLSLCEQFSLSEEEEEVDHGRLFHKLVHSEVMHDEEKWRFFIYFERWSRKWVITMTTDSKEKLMSLYDSPPHGIIPWSRSVI